MKHLTQTKALLASLFLLVFTSNIAYAAKQSTVKGMRFWQSPERTRVVIDLSGPVNQTVFSLKNPNRVVIDLPDTKFGLDLDAIKITSDLVSKVRKSQTGENEGLRIVLDLKEDSIPKTFALKPYLKYGHRLVIDLTNLKSAQAKKIIKPKAGNVIIAVDPGHGGEDPGGSSVNGKREKHITLKLAKKVVAELNTYPGVQAFLTRSGDYYVGLRKRTEIARKNRAHLFVSIHADAFPQDKRVRGSSVWTLSTKRSNSELGRWVARKANEDLLGVAENLDLDDFDAQVAEVLVNLSQEYAIGSSIDVASMVLEQIGRVGKLHSNKPRSESFAVLTSPGIPSVLVETGFISNSYDVKNLTSRTYQKKFAKALSKGLFTYLKKHPPEGTKLALKNLRHKVESGDTLSQIASTYGVSIKQIKKTNNLSNSILRAGQTIEIPR
jgi:N-acetylmuramoyl-L-alanine amidase